jgi:hypothetical protein
LQNALRELAYDVTADGSYGPKTSGTLADFQRLYTVLTGEVLVADGVLNDATRVALRSARENRLFSRLPEALRPGRVVLGYERGKPRVIVVRSLGDGRHRLETRAALAYYAMRASARQTGAAFQARDSFRTMQGQLNVGAKYADEPGRAATPGYSTHQTGIALDMNMKTMTGAGDRWLRANGPKFGFVLPNHPYITAKGHAAVEEWHWEYRADRLPNAVRQFYGLPELPEDAVTTTPPVHRPAVRSTQKKTSRQQSRRR